MSRANSFLASVMVLAMLFGAAPAAAAPGPGNAPEYWFDTWQLMTLWQATGARGQGVTIAEIDTGINASLPELANNVLPGKDFGAPGDGRTDREISTFGHGTAMASIMVAQPGVLGITGIAPDAKLLPVAVPLTGTTDAGGDDHLPQAIRWAADHGGKIISMSLGGARRPTTDDVPCPAEEQSAVFYALQKGAILLASSGNTGVSSNAVEEPGVCLGVISVGAVDQNGVVADFSARHPYLTLSAPGVNVPSLSRVLGSAYRGDGTSQATAITSAVFALVWSRYPKLAARQIVARVLATTDRHSNARDPAYGYGVVNAYRAVTATVPTTAPNPVYSFADPFIARANELAMSINLKAPTPVPDNSRSGSFSIGHSPRLLVPRVLEGLAVAVAGLVALLALIVLSLVRRHRQLADLPPPLVAGWGEQSPQTTTDTAGVVWHEIIDPHTESDSMR